MTAGRLPMFLPEEPPTLTDRILAHLATTRATARQVAYALGVAKGAVASLLSKMATWGRIQRDYSAGTRTHRLVAVYWL